MKSLLSLTLVWVLLFTLVSCDESFVGNDGANTTVNDAANTSQTQNPEEIEIVPPRFTPYPEHIEPNEPDEPLYADGYTWTVEPTLDYVKINYCEKHDDYHVSVDREEENKLLDEKTGLMTGEDHIWYGGSGRKLWVYDQRLNSLGYYDEAFEGLVMAPIGDFAEKFPDEVSTVKVVYYIDSTLSDADGKFLSENAFSGDKALVFSKDLISYNHETNTEVDTELLRGKEEGDGRRVANLVALRNTDDGKYGIIYKNGDVIVPFTFDEILIIDEKTAFAKSDGKYGIIAFNT